MVPQDEILTWKSLISYSSKTEDEGRINELEITIETIRIERYVYKFSVACFALSSVYLKSRVWH